MNNRKIDYKIWNLIRNEKNRQELNLNLIASENYASTQVLQAQGSILTNKYAEGYAKKRYYSGCNFVDQIEKLTISRVNKLFRCKYSNVQPHSGSQANEAIYFSLLDPGDSILSMKLDHGGHLSHGFEKNLSGKIYKSYFYGLNKKLDNIDYHMVRKMSIKHKPKIIIAGYSSFSKIINWKIFKEIAKEVNAYLLADMSHISGLISANLYPSPINIAHVITSTTHKTLKGPRGGIIISQNKAIQKKVNSAVFPGIQGGPFMHVIAAKAIAFEYAFKKNFIFYQKKVLKNAKLLSKFMIDNKFRLISNITDNHLLLIDLSCYNISGKSVEQILLLYNIIVNKNMIPFDKKNSTETSGIRIGTPSITTRGFNTKQIKMVSDWIYFIVKKHKNDRLLHSIKKDIVKLCEEFPVYSYLK